MALLDGNVAIVTGASSGIGRVIGVNLTGTFGGCKRTVAQIPTRAPHGEVRGHIVNISSWHGMIAAPGDAAYGVSVITSVSLLVGGGRMAG
jgi:NAD(P)-dependent dehydrogenase (short-subunit alcohol dehydrogenase family)